MPVGLRPLALELLDGLGGRTFAEMAHVVATHMLSDDLPKRALEEIIEQSLDFETPLVRLDERTWVLELYHGPTAAFKDVGARFMAQLMAHYLRPDERELTVLVATSGDTGSAIAHAFHGLAGVRVVVLFPRGQVSQLQQRLFTTLGGNVEALGVNGTFDDCQRLVKQAFADQGLREARFIASGNSINVGRLLPQTFYYFHAVAQLPHGGATLLISTPSGNFGNLTAGLLAKRLGLPCDQFVAATNVNDVVPEYLRTGRFEPRASVRTVANAMDVGNPSNFARLLHLYDDDVETIRRDICGSHHADHEALSGIGDVRRRLGYLLDPHSAIGYLGLQEARKDFTHEAHGIFLATAHPAKFADIVETATGEGVEIPERLSDCLRKPERWTPFEADYSEFREFLMVAATG
jgi:threonine synthase